MEKLADVTFKSVHTFTHDQNMTGDADDCVVAEVHFDMTYGGNTTKDLVSSIKMTSGDKASNPTLEVQQPANIPVVLVHAPFHETVTKYYNSQFGTQGSFIHAGEDSSDIVIDNCISESELKCRLPILEDRDRSGGW